MKNKIRLIDAIKLLRPRQWTKNIILTAAFFFAYWDPSQQLDLNSSLKTVALAFLFFCMASSGIYALNDIIDVEADRHHPKKKHRPIASGNIPVPVAWIIAGLMLIGSCLGASCLSPLFLIVVFFYIILQLIYCLGLKRIAFIDIVVIASGFVLRALAGAVVLDIVISPWLLLCTFLLALFLALCKRRHEKLLLSQEGENHRANLKQYDEHLLDQMIAIISGATIVSYSIYTLAPETVLKFGTHNLGFTIPFVIFGIFRYLDLVYRHEKGGHPEKILLTDLPLLLDIALYGISIIIIFLLNS